MYETKKIAQKWFSMIIVVVILFKSKKTNDSLQILYI